MSEVGRNAAGRVDRRAGLAVRASPKVSGERFRKRHEADSALRARWVVGDLGVGLVEASQARFGRAFGAGARVRHEFVTSSWAEFWRDSINQAVGVAGLVSRR